MTELERLNIMINKLTNYGESTGRLTKQEAENFRQYFNNTDSTAILKHLMDHPIDLNYLTQERLTNFEKKFPGLLSTLENLK